MKPGWVGAAAVVALAGCGGSAAPVRIHLSSPAFTAGGRIPRAFTCQGLDASPPLRWSNVPRRTRQLELTMRDPDAGNFIHWQLTGIPASTRAMAPGQVPTGASAGRNSFGSVGYRGPCPPRGPAHHYVITLTARSGTTTLGTGTLTGTYARR
jgi:Raf kinase inhibitor-like YbhB/YbcL family protein